MKNEKSGKDTTGGSSFEATLIGLDLERPYR